MARQRAIHAERDIILPILSVCPSVRPMPELCLNEWTHRHTFRLSARDIIAVFKPYRRYKNPRETPSGALNIRGVGKFGKCCHLSR